MTTELGLIKVLTYKPKEREFWKQFEINLLAEMTMVCKARFFGDKLRTIEHFNELLKKMLNGKEENKDKLQYHSDNAAKIFLGK